MVGFSWESPPDLWHDTPILVLKPWLGEIINLAGFYAPSFIALLRYLRTQGRGRSPITIYSPLAFWLMLAWLLGACARPRLILHDNPKLFWTGRASFWLLLPLFIAGVGRSSFALVNQSLASAIVGHRRQRFTEIPNSLDPVFIDPSPDWLTRDQKRIAFVGSGTPAKGWDILCREAALVHSQDPSITIHCHLAMKPIINCPIPPNVLIDSVGSTRIDVANTLKQCAFLVCCSRSESFGLPVLEAMACGTIPVSTPTLGVSSFLQHEINGFFFNSKPGELAKTILALQKAPNNTLYEIAQRAHSTAGRYSTDATETALVSFLQIESTMRSTQ